MTPVCLSLYLLPLLRRETTREQGKGTEGTSNFQNGVNGVWGAVGRGILGRLWISPAKGAGRSQPPVYLSSWDHTLPSRLCNRIHRTGSLCNTSQVLGEGTRQLEPSHRHSLTPPPQGFPFHFLPAWEGRGQNSLLGQALKNHFLCAWGRASSCRVDLGVPKWWEQEKKPLEEQLLSREPSRLRTMKDGGVGGVLLGPSEEFIAGSATLRSSG